MTSSFTTPRLPPEIIHHIIRQADDVQSLKNWALVNWSTNAIAERLLWANITMSTAEFYDDELAKENRMTPLRALQNEQARASRNWAPLQPTDTELPPITRRLPHVKYLSFRTVWDIDSRDLPHRGVKEGAQIFKIYDQLFPALTNVTSVRIDGEVTRKTWNALMTLPALRGLRIWRTETLNPEALLKQSRAWTEGEDGVPGASNRHLLKDLVLDFKGFNRLLSFEIGLMSPLESAALGNAVRKSKLEKLQISVTRDSKATDNQGPQTLERFFRHLVPIEVEREEYSRVVSDVPYGFPPSLKELVIEDDAHV